MATWPVIEYRIDGADRIVSVNDAWTEAAGSDAGPELLPPGVLGRSLWEAIGDPAARQLYGALVGRLRAGAGPVNLVFRCDTPENRLDLLDAPALPQLTHGICPTCSTALDAALGTPPSGEPSDIVVGDRLPS